MALTSNEKWDGGFVRTLDGRLVLVHQADAVGVKAQGGYLRDADGRLVVRGAS